MSQKKVEHVELGKIIQAKGLKGHVVAHIEFELTTLNFIKYLFIKMGSTMVPYQLEEGIVQGDIALLKFHGIEDRDTAHDLIDKTIWLPKEMLNKIIDTTETHQEIIGYNVIDIQEGNLGVIQHIEEYPMQQCLVVKYLEKEVLIPYVSAFIQQLDHKNKQVIVKLPPGYLEAIGCK